MNRNTSMSCVLNGDVKPQFENEMNRYLAIYNSHAQEWYLGWSVDKRKNSCL